MSETIRSVDKGSVLDKLNLHQYSCENLDLARLRTCCSIPSLYIQG